MYNKVLGAWDLSDIYQQIDTTHSSRLSGFEILDAHTKLPGSGLLVVEGRTKHGKSAAAIALTSKMLRSNLEQRIIFYSYEMTASKVFFRYVKTVAPEATTETFRELRETNEVEELIHQGRLQIVDQSMQVTFGDLLVAVNKPELRDSVVVIDYLQIVPFGTYVRQASRQLMIKEMLDELRVAAHNNNMLIIVLSQLTPDYADPRHDSPREAKDIHYSADMVLRIWNKSVGETHPTYANINHDYIIQVYLNRDGESNVVYGGKLLGGSQLELVRRVKEK